MGSAVAVRVTPAIFCEIPSWREPWISHLNPLCWDWLMTWSLYADPLCWWPPCRFLVIWVLFTKKRRLIPADAGVSLSEVLQPCHPRAFDRWWWLPPGLWTCTNPFGLLTCLSMCASLTEVLCYHLGPQTWSLSRADRVTEGGKWGKPKYCVWYLLSPGHHFMAEIFGVFSINSCVVISKTAVVSKPWR